MIALFILSLLGIAAGALGGALTNGLEGMILGGSAGFVLGVFAWITDNIKAEQQSRDVLPEELLNDLNAIARLQRDPRIPKIEHGQWMID